MLLPHTGKIGQKFDKTQRHSGVSRDVHASALACPGRRLHHGWGLMQTLMAHTPQAVQGKFCGLCCEVYVNRMSAHSHTHSPQTIIMCECTTMTVQLSNSVH